MTQTQTDIVREKVRKALQGRKDLSFLSKATGCTTDLLYKFRRGDAGLGYDKIILLCVELDLLPATGDPIKRAHANVLGGARKSLRLQSPHGTILNNEDGSPTIDIPAEFDVDMHEAEAILLSRKKGAYTFLKLAVRLTDLPITAVESIESIIDSNYVRAAELLLRLEQSYPKIKQKKY